MNAVSLIMPYHSAARMLQVHANTLVDLPKFLYDEIDVRVCDDASPTPIDEMCFAFVPCVGGFYRIEPPHIRWSHRCATNIAASHATGEWFLITDMDHVVSVDAWRRVLALWANGDLDPATVYTFKRENRDGSPYKSHPDSWLMHRTMWKRIGGYDTRYRGHYGQNMPFKLRVNFHARTQVELPIALTRYTREDIGDASMPVDFGRKSERDRQAIHALQAKFGREGTFYKPGDVIPHTTVFEC